MDTKGYDESYPHKNNRTPSNYERINIVSHRIPSNHVRINNRTPSNYERINIVSPSNYERVDN